MKKTTKVLKGKIENVKRVRTRTGNSMVTFTVGETPCKAFGKGAETVSQWLQVDPNSAGEFEGFFEKRSEKFGQEFVAVHGKPIQTETIEKAGRLELAASGTGASGNLVASADSVTPEPIPAEKITGKVVSFPKPQIPSMVDYYETDFRRRGLMRKELEGRVGCVSPFQKEAASRILATMPKEPELMAVG